MNSQFTLLSETYILLEDCLQGKADVVIDREHFRQWMKTDDIECLGLLHEFLLEAHCVKRVRPALENHEVMTFFLNFWKRCLAEDTQREDLSSYSVSRYEAGWEIAYFLRARAKEDSEDDIQRIVQMLTTVYLAGGKDLRLCVECATLEHVLNVPKIRKAFSQWKKDPVLAQAILKSKECCNLFVKP